MWYLFATTKLACTVSTKLFQGYVSREQQKEVETTVFMTNV